MSVFLIRYAGQPVPMFAGLCIQCVILLTTPIKVDPGGKKAASGFARFVRIPFSSL